MARPSPRAYFRNLRSSDYSATQKAYLVLKNNAIKLRNRSDCCGNHGEPGC